MSLTIQSGGSVTIQGGGGGGGGGGATVGTFANRPAAGTSGRIYIATDSPIAQWVDDGSAWRPLIQGQALGTQVPAASAFTAFNDGDGLSFGDNAGTISLSTTSLYGSDVMRGAVVSLPWSTTQYVEGAFACLQANKGINTHNAVGITLRNSTTGNYFSVVQLSFAKMGDAPTLDASYEAWWGTNNGPPNLSTRSGALSARPNVPTFARIYTSGPNIVAALSADGVTWQTLHTLSDAHFSGNRPNQVGIALVSYSQTTGSLMSFKYGYL